MRAGIIVLSVLDLLAAAVAASHAARGIALALAVAGVLGLLAGYRMARPSKRV